MRSWCLARSPDVRLQLLEADAQDVLVELLNYWLGDIMDCRLTGAPVVKLAEFAVAALWLLVIGPDGSLAGASAEEGGAGADGGAPRR